MKKKQKRKGDGPSAAASEPSGPQIPVGPGVRGSLALNPQEISTEELYNEFASVDAA